MATEQMPGVAHENRDQRRADRAAAPVGEWAEQAPVAEESAPAGEDRGKGNGENGE